MNLGIGLPTLVANEVSGMDIVFQSENGLLGIGAYPLEGALMRISLMQEGNHNRGAGCFVFQQRGFVCDDSWGHIDLAILGGMEVSQNGDLANWMIPKKLIKGMGGAMDLVHGAKK